MTTYNRICRACGRRFPTDNPRHSCCEDCWVAGEDKKPEVTTKQKKEGEQE
jgi:rRNA maturation endonuclease Nob1